MRQSENLPLENDAKIHLMNETELLEDQERMETLLERGELSIREGRRLRKVRLALAQIEFIKERGW